MGTTRTDREPKDQTDIPDSDGAVRELEKTAITAQQTAERKDNASSSREEPPVVSLGKAGGGAPEEDAADASEITANSAPSASVPAEGAGE